MRFVVLTALLLSPAIALAADAVDPNRTITLTSNDLTLIVNAAIAQARAQDAANLAKPAIDKVQKQIAPPQKEPMKDDKK